jgi:hypothetical protein
MCCKCCAFKRFFLPHRRFVTDHGLNGPDRSDRRFYFLITQKVNLVHWVHLVHVKLFAHLMPSAIPIFFNSVFFYLFQDIRITVSDIKLYIKRRNEKHESNMKPQKLQKQ